MPAVVIDGAAVAAKLRLEAAQRAAKLRDRGVAPCLAVVLVGENAASLSYVRAKEKALAAAGMASRDVRLAEHTSQAELLALIQELNTDAAVHGILVQLPLPRHISEDAVITAISPQKDVDGFHPESAGNVLLGRPGFLPCTPHGVLVLLREIGVPLAGAHAVVVGRSNIVGRPLAVLLARKDCNATVTVCHTGTADLSRFTRDADILIAAAGSPALISGDMIKEGAVVIDVGVNRVTDSASPKGYRLCGDVDFASASRRAAYITPVPGGVGPMTIAMLLHNLIRAAEGSFA